MKFRIEIWETKFGEDVEQKHIKPWFVTCEGSALISKLARIIEDRFRVVHPDEP